MRSAKKREPEGDYEPGVTPEQIAEIEAGLAEIERGEYVEIEFDDDDDVPEMMVKLRRALRGEHA